MNKVVLMGRLVKDIEVRESGDFKIGRFSIAVPKKTNKDETNFFNCVAWNKQATFIQQYFTKGNRIALIGRLEQNKYKDKDGNEKSIIEIVVDEAEFVENKAQNQAENEDVPPPPKKELVEEQIAEDDLPF